MGRDFAHGFDGDFHERKNSITRITGTYRGYFTGIISDPDRVEIRISSLNGQSITIMARFAVAFPNIGMVSREWLNKYKNSFNALVVFENADPDRPIIVALLPFSDSPSHTGRSESPRYSTSFEGVLSSFILDNQTGAYTAKNDETNVGLHGTKDDVHIGKPPTEDDDFEIEPTLYGKKTIDLLKKLIEYLEATKVSTTMGPQPLLNATQIAALKNDLEDLLTLYAKVT